MLYLQQGHLYLEKYLLFAKQAENWLVCIKSKKKLNLVFIPATG